MERKTLFAEKQIQGHAPEFFGDTIGVTDGYDGMQISPDVSVYQCKSVSVIGRTEFIQSGRTLYYPKNLNPSLFAFMIEIEERGKVHQNKTEISILPRKSTKKLGRAISLLGQCSGNYAHWLTEAMSRLALIESMDEFRGIPILVDRDTHPKLQYILALVNNSQREIITVRAYEPVFVESLIYVGLPGITPAETRRVFETGELDTPHAKQYQFCPDALQQVSAIMKDYLPQRGISDCGEGEDNSMLYLSRTPASTGNGRHLLNQSTVMRLLKSMGVIPFDVFNASFESVVEIFQTVRVVVSPIGAALANLIFSPPGVTVIILTPHYPSASFYYFSNLLIALGHDVTFVLGHRSQIGGSNLYNSDYFIRLPLLEEAMEEVLNKRSDDPIEPVLLGL
ncbi:glycosyltransferase family 61 protein [Cognatiyoonia sp. IB215182]|uniref:glycosyltransferase family 61 protein n=1 Tax=Cognatiyoonia sp. IB215182 TaxID=3097353 RepID=UPI002A0E2DEE|nr:glycosyltransferase 61 family protein [Cognatiyoonia sp. IB215182]MDX8354712.1 glycosyltransferase 61 family protein [Cognatiyoonia sp. IB215182]